MEAQRDRRLLSIRDDVAFVTALIGEKMAELAASLEANELHADTIGEQAELLGRQAAELKALRAVHGEPSAQGQS